MKPHRISFWKQMINIPAILRLQHVSRHPAMLIPDIHVSSLNDLDIEQLKQTYNIKYIVFDKDNTLSLPYHKSVHPSVSLKLSCIISAFGHHNIAILSNSVGSSDDDGYAGAVETEEMMKIPVIRHQHKKPGCLDEVIQHFIASSSYDTHNGKDKNICPSEICVIGDRLLTDVVFANSNGMVSVLVAPLTILRDHPIAVIIRSVELWLILPVVRLLGYHSINKRC